LDNVDFDTAQAFANIAGVKMPIMPSMTLSPKDKTRVMEEAELAS
jgi:hypothetical protein